MKKLLLFTALFLQTCDVVFAQTAPSGYTFNYRLRKWIQGANPHADSLNANWDKIDSLGRKPGYTKPDSLLLISGASTAGTIRGSVSAPEVNMELRNDYHGGTQGNIVLVPTPTGSVFIMRGSDYSLPLGGSPDSMLTVTLGGHFKGGLLVDKNAVVSGTLGVTGATTLSSTLSSGAITASGLITGNAGFRDGSFQLTEGFLTTRARIRPTSAAIGFLELVPNGNNGSNIDLYHLDRVSDGVNYAGYSVLTHATTGLTIQRFAVGSGTVPDAVTLTGNLTVSGTGTSSIAGTSTFKGIASNDYEFSVTGDVQITDSLLVSNNISTQGNLEASLGSVRGNYVRGDDGGGVLRIRLNGNAPGSLDYGSNGTILIDSGAINGIGGTGIGKGIRIGGGGSHLIIALGPTNGYDFSGGFGSGILLKEDTLVIRSGSLVYMPGAIFTPQVYSNATSERAVFVDSDGDLGTTASSYRYKNDITPLEVNTSLLYRLRPISFNWLKGEKDRDWGLIAEEVQTIMPELVGLIDGKPEWVKYERLPVLLLAEIQKLNERIKILEKAK